MKTYWPLALIALFLVCCTSENPASDDPVDGDSSSSSYEVSGSSSGHHHHHRSSSSSGANPGKPDVVQDTLIHDTTTVSAVDDLPECTSAKEGESFLVKSENILRFCVGGEWIASDVVKEFFELGCRDGMLVLNGAGEEIVESSSSHGTTSPWGGNYGNFGGQNNSTMDMDTEPHIVGKRVLGVAEKGPFRYGASVKIVELDSMQRLGDSKRSHRTCITEASGKYSFDSVDLASPYLRMEANGYFDAIGRCGRRKRDLYRRWPGPSGNQPLSTRCRCFTSSWIDHRQLKPTTPSRMLHTPPANSDPPMHPSPTSRKSHQQPAPR